MNQFKLKVPVWVLKVEGELKKEWEAENRKIKKSLAAGAKSGEKSSVAKPKAKAVQGGKNDVNVTGKLDWGITSTKLTGVQSIFQCLLTCLPSTATEPSLPLRAHQLNRRRPSAS
jgi:hypothetical protein